MATAKQMTVETSWTAVPEAPLLPLVPDPPGLEAASPPGPGPPVKIHPP